MSKMMRTIDSLRSGFKSTLGLKRRSRPSVSASAKSVGKNPTNSDSSLKDLNPKIRSVLKKGRRKRRRRFTDRKEEEDYLEELMLSQKLDYLARKTNFSYEEIVNLSKIFTALTSRSTTRGEMDRTVFCESFQNFFGIHDRVMLDQIFYAFDSNHEGTISVTEWIINLSHLLRGNLDEQIQYCYSIYDMNGDGGIGRQEIAKLLEGCVAKIPGIDEDIYENPRDIFDTVYKKLDHENTGQVTYTSFRDVVYRDPLFLECLGNCLPNANYIRTFMLLVTEHYEDYTTNYSLEGDPTYSIESKRYSQQFELHRKHMMRLEKSMRERSAQFARARKHWQTLQAVSKHIGALNVMKKK